MSLEELGRFIADFIRENREWALPIVFVLAFGECLAFVSFLIPATVIFGVFGTAAGGAGLNPFPLAVAAALGSILGFWVSLWLGKVWGPEARNRWPFTRWPAIWDKGLVFFNKWGWASIFLAHFQGQLRPFLPLFAGIYGMNPIHFHAANVSASVLWAVLTFYGTNLLGQQLAG